MLTPVATQSTLTASELSHTLYMSLYRVRRTAGADHEMELGGQRFASPDGAACQPYLCGVCKSSALCPCSSVCPDPVLANLSFSQKKTTQHKGRFCCRAPACKFDQCFRAVHQPTSKVPTNITSFKTLCPIWFAHK